MTTATLELEPNARAIAEKHLRAAWDAFDNHRPELGSRRVWDAAETALRQLARQHNFAIDTVDQRLEFAKTLDAKNGSDRYYNERLSLCEYFEDNALMGVMPGSDPTRYAPIAAEFIEHLLTLAEGTP